MEGLEPEEDGQLLKASTTADANRNDAMASKRVDVFILCSCTCTCRVTLEQCVTTVLN